MGLKSPRKPPGQDEHSVRHPDGPVAWEPVITRPDPMTAEEWEVLLEHDLAEDLDPGEFVCEDDFLNPDADLTGAELAEIGAAAGG